MLNNRDVSSVQTSTLVPVHSLAVRALQGWARSSGCVIRFRKVCAEEEAAAAAGQCGWRAQPGLTYRMQYTNFHPILVAEGKGSSGLLGSEEGCLEGRVVIVGIVVISEQVSCVDEMVAEQQVKGLLCGDVPVRWPSWRRDVGPRFWRMRAQKSSKAWWYPSETVSGSLAYSLMYLIAASRSRRGCRSTLALRPSRTT